MLAVKLPEVAELAACEPEVVGFCEVDQQMPVSVTVAPPFEVIVPPEIALVAPIELAELVVNRGATVPTDTLTL
jgi:hypothetical protein